LRQILINLLSNAFKFTPAGGEITIRARRHGDGQHAELVVADTGIGIADRDIAMCLSPFGQVEKSDARKHSGTGLGLPLSRKFAELLGGRLEVSSAPGRGTEVRVLLPLALRASAELVAA
jgi:two-component system cell cycle sensor histidine kinase PleC